MSKIPGIFPFHALDIVIVARTTLFVSQQQMPSLFAHSRLVCHETKCNSSELLFSVDISGISGISDIITTDGRWHMACTTLSCYKDEKLCTIEGLLEKDQLD